MNEDILISKLKEYLLPKLKRTSCKGRPYSITNEQLVDAIFLCS